MQKDGNSAKPENGLSGHSCNSEIFSSRKDENGKPDNDLFHTNTLSGNDLFALDNSV